MTTASDTSTDGDTSAFLCDVLARRVERDQDLALGAMSVLGRRKRRGVIRRSLRSDDYGRRAQAIEALDSIGDRRLGSAVTKLVEHRPGRDTRPETKVIARLRHDDDPWISGLARRVGREGERMPEASPSL